MVKDILGHKRDTLRGHICLFSVNIPHLDIFDIFLLNQDLSIRLLLMCLFIETAPVISAGAVSVFFDF